MSEPSPSAIDRFREMFADLTSARVRELGPLIYAEDAHFNDTIVDLDGREAIVDYLAETAGRTEECKVVIDDAARGEDGVYLRWTMRFVAKRLNRGRPVDSIGLTHLRLGEDGLVSHHQDYWDSRAGLFEHVPVLGWMLRSAVKRAG